jgi:hypothetical protein
MPIILATWEAEIRKIMVQSQNWQIIFKTPISKNNQNKMDWRCGSSDRAKGKALSLKSTVPQNKTI